MLFIGCVRIPYCQNNKIVMHTYSLSQRTKTSIGYGQLLMLLIIAYPLAY